MEYDNTSRVLGITGVGLGWIMPIIGITCGSLGLMVLKETEKENRKKSDIFINIASIVWSVFWWVLYWVI